METLPREYRGLTRRVGGISRHILRAGVLLFVWLLGYVTGAVAQEQRELHEFTDGVEVSHLKRIQDPSRLLMVWFAEVAACTSSSGNINEITFYTAEVVMVEGDSAYGVTVWEKDSEKVHIIIANNQSPVELEDTVRHELIHYFHPKAVHGTWIFEYCTLAHLFREDRP